MVTRIQESGLFSRTMNIDNTQYEKHHYKGQRLTQLQRKFPHVTYDVNEAEITTGLRSVYLGRKVSKNQAEFPSIEYRTNIGGALEEAIKGPSATHIRNMKRIEELLTLDRNIKYIEGKFSKPGTTFITQQQTDGSTL